jgi:hypothetical protein
MSLSIREAVPRPPTPAATSSPIKPAPPTEGPSQFSRVLHGLGNEMQQGEALMHSAMSASRGSRELAPTELLALQAGVYRYSEAVDLTAKLIDRASTGMKTVLQGQ